MWRISRGCLHNNLTLIREARYQQTLHALVSFSVHDLLESVGFWEEVELVGVMMSCSFAEFESSHFCVHLQLAFENLWVWKTGAYQPWVTLNITFITAPSTLQVLQYSSAVHALDSFALSFCKIVQIQTNISPTLPRKEENLKTRSGTSLDIELINVWSKTT